MNRNKGTLPCQPLTLICFIFAVISLLWAPLITADQFVDRKLAGYRPGKKLQGSITSRGSDTMRRLMFSWAVAFRRHHPDVVFDIVAKGSGTAPNPLLRRVSHIGPMSRKMEESENQQFIDKFGVRPVAVSVGLDALAIYINQRNPISSLSLDELDAIFSKTLKRGYPRNVTSWGQLGLSGSWQEMPIRLYTRNTFSGTFEYFRKRVLFNGEYKDCIQMQPDSTSVVDKVTSDPAGIGYSGIGYDTANVKVLPLSKKRNDKSYSASHENTNLKRYPLSRPLYIYLLKLPDRPVPEVVREFIAFVLSREGQQIIHEVGYVPLSAQTASRQLGQIQ